MSKKQDDNSEPQQPTQVESKFNQSHYNKLVECFVSGKDSVVEWNSWRKNNPTDKILLQGAKLPHLYLQGKNPYLRPNLQGAYLSDADLKEAVLCLPNLKGANLHSANLKGAKLPAADLQGANFMQANLEDADFTFADLQGATFRAAIVNGNTCFLGCKTDKNTDFRHVALGNIRIESRTKYLLKYNNRRLNWQDWYDRYSKNSVQKWLVKLFWSISDYGNSTLRIIVWFFALAIFFAGLYYIFSIVSPPGIVSDLLEGKEGIVPKWLVPIRAIYFSVVTMTTLGFGDIYANCQSFLGHLLLILQVILGYVLLGALVTRLAVLFTSEGPSGEYFPMSKDTKELLNKLRTEKSKNQKYCNE